MGVSTNGLLFYGNLLGEDYPECAGGEVEWPEMVALKRGHKNPWDAFPQENYDKPYDQRRAVSDAWRNANREAIDQWRNIRKQIEAEFGCEFQNYCSGDVPMYAVIVSASAQVGRRGYPVEAKPLVTDPSWAGMLQRFADELGFKLPDGEPKWWLGSYWG